MVAKRHHTVGLTGLKFSFDRSGPLLRTASINRAVQKSVPTSLQPLLLLHSQYPALAGHLRKRLGYDSMQREY